MPRRNFLSFANLTAVVALVIATSTGGLAVAAGLGKNVVGSAQIKPNAVKSADVKNNALTGNDIKESTLGSVPAAAKADTAATVDTVVTKRVTANPGQTVVLATNSTLVVELECYDAGGGDLDAYLRLRTTADHVAFAANLDGSTDSDLNVSDGPALITDAGATSQDIEDGGFSAVTAAGLSWKGYGWAMVHHGGSNTCTAEVTFLG